MEYRKSAFCRNCVAETNVGVDADTIKLIRSNAMRPTNADFKAAGSDLITKWLPGEIRVSYVKMNMREVTHWCYHCGEPFSVGKSVCPACDRIDPRLSFLLVKLFCRHEKANGCVISYTLLDWLGENVKLDDNGGYKNFDHDLWAKIMSAYDCGEWWNVLKATEGHPLHKMLADPVRHRAMREDEESPLTSAA